jgi:Ca-activated chloride channel family protein
MNPILITVVILVGAVGVLLVLGSRQRRPSAGGGAGRARPAAASARRPKTPTQRSPFQKAPFLLRALPVVLLIGAIASLGVALAQFRVSKTAKPPTVMLVLDASLSMNQTDVQPSRIAAAQDAAETFVEQLPKSFLVGLVTFSDEAQVPVQPTADHSRIAPALKDPQRGKGTKIGDGLDASLAAIQSEWDAGGSAPAAVVLLSDGRDTGSTVDPMTAAGRAAGMEVPVYTVVLGKTSGPGAADAALLQQIAQTTGATSENAETASDLSSIYQALGTQLSTQLQISSSAQLFVIIAVVLAMGAAVVVLILAQRRDQF